MKLQGKIDDTDIVVMLIAGQATISFLKYW